MSSMNCAQCLGLLPDKWLSAGKSLLEKAREAEEDAAATTPEAAMAPGIVMARRSSSGSRAFDLETILTAFKAQSDFPGAMQDIRAIEDKAKRCQALNRVIQRLGNR